MSTLLDPSDYFNAWYGKDGPQNYSFWDNKEFQALTAQIDRELDAEKRQDLIRQAEAIMERSAAIAGLVGKDQRGLVQYVKGIKASEYFGIFDMVRQDTVWLDKA